MPMKTKKKGDAEALAEASKSPPETTEVEKTASPARRSLRQPKATQKAPSVGEDLKEAKPKRAASKRKASASDADEAVAKSADSGQIVANTEEAAKPTLDEEPKSKRSVSRRKAASEAGKSEAEAKAQVQQADADVEAKPAKAQKRGKAAKADDGETIKRSDSKSDTSEKVVIPRTPIPRYVPAPSARTLKVITWNITTLRSLVNKNAALLKKLFDTEKPDLVCMQEIKLNAEDQAEYEAKLQALLPGHTFHWNFCTLPDSKSYSGTLAIVAASDAPGGPQKTLDAFFKAKGPASASAAGGGGSAKLVGVTAGLPTLTDADGPVAREAAQEGRVLTVEYDRLFVVASYVPNSGDKLQRLDFRAGVWDRRTAEHLASLRARAGGKPVVYCGDLNVAHLDADIWNAGAKHIATSAGTTPRERESFAQQMEEAGLRDAFRALHPGAQGCFSYWSVRAGNRPFNRGLRLDYFLASGELLPPPAAGDEAPAAAAASAAPPPPGGAVVREVAILPDFVAIDHAAMVLTLELA